MSVHSQTYFARYQEHIHRRKHVVMARRSRRGKTVTDQFGRTVLEEMDKAEQWLLNNWNDNDNPLVRVGRCAIGRAVFLKQPVSQGDPIIAYQA